MTTISIPLFPLHTVLFPQGMLPLRIFEPRYLEMVSNCLKDEKDFSDFNSKYEYDAMGNTISHEHSMDGSKEVYLYRYTYYK